MPAAIQNVGGKSLFASHRVPAWHGLGTVFTEPVTDYRVMLAKAGLADWDVRQEEMTTTETGLIVPGRFANIATINGEDRVLGVVGGRYEIVQNEDKFSWLQSLSDGCLWETGGMLEDGTVFGSLAFERETVLDPNGVADFVKMYALIFGDHGGNSAITGGLTPQRVVCRNTLNVAIGNLRDRMGFRHTASVHDRMKAAAHFFRSAHEYFDAFEVEAQALYATPVSDKKYENLVTRVIGKAPEDNVKGRLSKYENKRDLFMQAWKGEPNAGIRGTAWGAFNALTEANQWGRNVQDTAKGQQNFFAAGAGFDGPTNVFRQQALALVKAIR